MRAFRRFSFLLLHSSQVGARRKRRGYTAAETPAAVDYSHELPRIAPTEPAEALKTFTVAPGFKIEQVAAEPLVNSPVAMEFDENGRLFVCEMRGYSENRDDKISRISMLDDIDGDGKFDKSTVFVDGLLWPTALFPFDGGLFVGDAPDIFYFKDTDGDGEAERRKKRNSSSPASARRTCKAC